MDETVHTNLNIWMKHSISLILESKFFCRRKGRVKNENGITQTGYKNEKLQFNLHELAIRHPRKK
jgi:beta-lactamase class D